MATESSTSIIKPIKSGSIEADSMPEHDSGCEQSPTQLSPTIPSNTNEEKKIKVYDRELLLKLQKSPFTKNPKAEDILWPGYENDGLFDPGRWDAKKEQTRAPSAPSRKDMSAEYVKPLIDGDILRPQRKSFVSGCQMSHVNNSNEKLTDKDKEQAEKSTSVQPDNKDRPRSVPTLERGDSRTDRRIGSGRLHLETRPDSRGSGRERGNGRPHTHADRRDNWRLRSAEEEDETSSGPVNYRGSTYYNRGERGGDNNHYHHHQSRKYHQQNSHTEAEPEWFTEEISQSDTIELRGFDHHHKEKKTKSRKSKKNDENKEADDSELSADSKSAERPDESANNSEANTTTNTSDNSQSLSTSKKDEFDLNSLWMSLDMNAGPLDLPGLQDSAKVPRAEKTASRFTRLFKMSEDNQTASPSMLNQDAHNSSKMTERNELHVEMNMDSLVKELLSPADDLLRNGDLLDDSESPPQYTSSQVNHRKSNDGGSMILRLLRNPPPSDHSSTDEAKSQRKKSLEADNSSAALPPALSKLLIPTDKTAADRSDAVDGKTGSKQPPIPAEFKTLEELEAGLGATKANLVADNKTLPKHNNKDEGDSILQKLAQAGGRKKAEKSASSSSSKSAETQQQLQQEMSAYNKLLAMLQDTGELKKNVPRMPEITNTETPNQMKKDKSLLSHTQSSGQLSQTDLEQALSGSSDLFSHQQTISAHPQRSHVQQQQPSQSMQQVPLHPQQMQPIPGSVNPSLFNLLHMRNTPPLPTGAPVSLAGLMHPGAPVSAAALVNLSNAAAQANIAAALQAGAMQPAVNPLVQQTIHQRQKLPSPIMFGAQPPVHLVAPAPIHPLGPPPLQHLINPGASLASVMPAAGPRSSPMAAATAMMDPYAMAAVSSQASQPIASMAFTPTSVIRKLANDKVDERQKLSEGQQLKQLIDNLQMSQQQQMARQKLQQQQQQQLQHPTSIHQQHQGQSMRPIVKNNTSVAEQLFQRQQQQQIVDQLLKHQQQQQYHQHQPQNLTDHHVFSTQSSSLPPSNQSEFNALQRQQQARQQQQQHISQDSIIKWFSSKDALTQNLMAGLPMPKHAPVLTLDDIEH